MQWRALSSLHATGPCTSPIPIKCFYDLCDVDSHSTIALSRESSSASSALPDYYSQFEGFPTLETIVRRLDASSDVSNPSSKTNTEKKRSKSVGKRPVPSVFKFQLLPGKFIKIAFDRLALLALFDR